MDRRRVTSFDILLALRAFVCEFRGHDCALPEDPAAPFRTCRRCLGTVLPRRCRGARPAAQNDARDAV
jgi:hypothetical protein